MVMQKEMFKRQEGKRIPLLEELRDNTNFDKDSLCGDYEKEVRLRRKRQGCILTTSAEEQSLVHCGW